MSIIYKKADETYIGRINLIDIRADLHNFGKEYPSSGQDAGFLRERIAKSEIIIACVDEEPVGFIIYEIKNTDKLCYIHQLSVAPEYQRQGIATSLMRKVIDESRSKNCIKICLTTTLDANWSMSLYEKLGFSQIDTRTVDEIIKRYLEDWLGYKPETKAYFELIIKG